MTARRKLIAQARIVIVNPYLHPDLIIDSEPDARLVPGALLPALGHEMRVGAGAYTGTAAAVHGASVSYLDWIGDDVFGDFTVAEIERLGHGIEEVRRYRGAHMLCVAVHETGQPDATMIATYPAPWQRDIDEIAQALGSGPHMTDAYVYSWFWSFSTPSFAGASTRELVAQVRSRADRVLLDPNWKPPGDVPKPDRTELLAALPQIDVLLPNRRDARALVGERSPRDTIRALLDLGPGAVVLTGGADGVYWGTAGDPITYHVADPILPGAVRDTVGAGDTFGGAFAASRGPVEEAVSLGLATASAAISGALASGEFDGESIRDRARTLLARHEEIN